MNGPTPRRADEGGDSPHPPRSPLLRAFRDRYVATFGGLSYDLAPGSAGVSPEVLESAPELVGRDVLVSDGRPLVERPAFTLVALDRFMRNARNVAAGGGIVFSSFDLDADPDAARLLERLHQGDTIYVNSAFDRLKAPAIRRPTFGA